MFVARNLFHGPSVIGFFAGWIVEDELHVTTSRRIEIIAELAVGRSLMEAATDEARRRGVTQILLEVRASNKPAQLLYSELGFNFVGRRRDYYRLPTEDALVMKLKLR